MNEAVDEEAKKRLMRGHKTQIAILFTRRRTPEHTAKIVAARTGRKQTEETKLRISISMTGKKHSARAREKMSEIRAEWHRWKDDPRFRAQKDVVDEDKKG